MNAIPLVKLGHDIPTGLGIENPNTEELAPLNESVFGRKESTDRASLSYAVASSNTLSWTRHAADNCSLVYTAWTKRIILNYGQTWAFNTVSYLNLLSAGVNLRILIDGSPLSNATGSSVRTTDNVFFGGYGDKDNSVENRSLVVSGSAVVDTVPGQTYLIRMQFATTNTSTSFAPSGYALSASISNRYITATPSVN